MTRWLAVVVAMSSCGPALLPGAPVPGSSCTEGAKRECVTTSSFAVCDNGKWFELQCDDRCSNQQTPLCTYTPKVGDVCPTSFEGFGSCESSTSLLKCTSGKWVRDTMECPRCERQPYGITCF